MASFLYPNLSWGGTGFPEGFKKFEGSTTDIKDLQRAGFMRYAQQFEHDYPEIAAKYFDLRFETA